MCQDHHHSQIMDEAEWDVWIFLLLRWSQSATTKDWGLLGYHSAISYCSEATGNLEEKCDWTSIHSIMNLSVHINMYWSLVLWVGWDMAIKNRGTFAWLYKRNRMEFQTSWTFKFSGEASKKIKKDRKQNKKPYTVSWGDNGLD